MYRADREGSALASTVPPLKLQVVYLLGKGHSYSQALMCKSDREQKLNGSQMSIDARSELLKQRGVREWDPRAEDV